MAVQKSKKSRAKRNTKRSANIKFIYSSLSIDKETGEVHKRHNVTKNGYYKGIQVIKTKKQKKQKIEDRNL